MIIINKQVNKATVGEIKYATDIEKTKNKVNEVSII